MLEKCKEKENDESLTIIGHYQGTRLAALTEACRKYGDPGALGAAPDGGGRSVGNLVSLVSLKYP